MRTVSCVMGVVGVLCARRAVLMMGSIRILIAVLVMGAVIMIVIVCYVIVLSVGSVRKVLGEGVIVSVLTVRISIVMGLQGVNLVLVGIIA